MPLAIAESKASMSSRSLRHCKTVSALILLGKYVGYHMGETFTVVIFLSGESDH